ncbi:MAG: hypothetical protein K2X47_14895 [Bdellovibrionales bacterium]|nr:hypothetical protein [Bdellovibrionales bacterium]
MKYSKKRARSLFLVWNLVAGGFLLGFIGGCSHSPQTPVPDLPRFSGDYLTAVSALTRTGHAYRGVNNLYQIRVTMLTSDLVARQIDQKRIFYGWDNKKTEEEAAKFRQQAYTETRFFVSFFTPDGSHNITEKNSLWRFLLQTGSQRLVGEPKLVTLPLADLQSDYPDHDRFSIPYMISFPVALDAAQNATSTFIMTGPLGNEEFVFAAGPR